MLRVIDPGLLRQIQTLPDSRVSRFSPIDPFMERRSILVSARSFCGLMLFRDDVGGGDFHVPLAGANGDVIAGHGNFPADHGAAILEHESIGATLHARVVERGPRTGNLSLAIAE